MLYFNNISGKGKFVFLMKKYNFERKSLIYGTTKAYQVKSLHRSPE